MVHAEKYLSDGLDQSAFDTARRFRVHPAERLIGSIRRECLDHVVVFSERHLRHPLLCYMKYYNGARTHLSLEISRSRAPSITPGTFFVAQSWADSITDMPGTIPGHGPFGASCICRSPTSSRPDMNKSDAAKRGYLPSGGISAISLKSFDRVVQGSSELFQGLCSHCLLKLLLSLQPERITFDQPPKTVVGNRDHPNPVIIGIQVDRNELVPLKPCDTSRQRGPI